MRSLKPEPGLETVLEELRLHMHVLSDTNREIVEMRIDGHSNAEIMKAMGLPNKNTVNMRLHFSRKKMEEERTRQNSLTMTMPLAISQDEKVPAHVAVHAMVIPCHRCGLRGKHRCLTDKDIRRTHDG
jgi:hypothetical protein